MLFKHCSSPGYLKNRANYGRTLTFASKHPVFYRLQPKPYNLLSALALYARQTLPGSPQTAVRAALGNKAAFAGCPHPALFPRVLAKGAQDVQSPSAQPGHQNPAGNQPARWTDRGNTARGEIYLEGGGDVLKKIKAKPTQKIICMAG